MYFLTKIKLSDVLRVTNKLCAGINSTLSLVPSQAVALIIEALGIVGRSFGLFPKMSEKFLLVKNRRKYIKDV